MTGAGLLVSVVIPTRNRRELLRETIESLWRQSLDPGSFEIIVVDNRSTDGTREMMQELVEKSPVSLRFHVMDENRGPARSRNKGASMARAPIIALTDSDCRADRNWLEEGIRPFDDPGVAMVTGAVFHKPEQQVRFFQRSHDPITQESPTFPAQNIFYRRQVFEQVGGFDETLCFRDFRGRVLECADTDLGWRMKETGKRTVFESAAVMYHEREPQTPLNWLLEPVYLFAVPLLVRRHPAIRSRLLRWQWFLSALHPPYYLFLLGLVLSSLLHSPVFLILGLPYVLAVARACWRRWTPGPLDTAAWVVLIGARQAVGTMALLYGSFRFRRLVL